MFLSIELGYMKYGEQLFRPQLLKMSETDYICQNPCRYFCRGSVTPQTQQYVKNLNSSFEILVRRFFLVLKKIELF